MTILEEIFKESKKDKINSLNKSFFNNYLNSDIILKLIDIRKLYLDILTFEKNKEEDIHTRDKLKIDLEEIINKKNELETENFNLLKKKIAIVKELTNKIDIKKIEAEEKINDNLINNTKSINDLTIEIDSIGNRINSLTINKYDKDMLVNALKYKINNLNNADLDYLAADKKELYNSKLNEIIFNESVRKCYTTYLFEMITYDLENLKHVYNISKNYMLISYKNDINISLENNSIILEYTINEKVLESTNKFLDIIMNNDLSNIRMSEISNEKLKHNSIIQNMNHFAKNYKELYGDKEIINKEYEMIRSFVVDLMRDTKNNDDNLIVSVINDTIEVFKNFSENI